MSKMKRLSLLGMIILCCVFSGCEKEESEPVTITIIHSWGSTEPDHAAMRDIYEGFQKENPDIRLQLIAMPTRQEMLRKVEDMIMVGDTLDIVTFSGMGKNRTYEFMVENDMALDLMPCLEADPEFAGCISKANLDYWVTEENQLFTVADALSLSGGYWYNEEIFEQAGIEEIPINWDEFLEMCGRLRIWSEEQGTGVRPLQASGEGYLYFADHILAGRREGMTEMTESSPLRLKGKELEETVARLKNIYQFSGSESAGYTYLDETSLFNEGKLAIYVNGAWGAPMISEDIHAGYALLPTESGVSMSCESACLGYVLGSSGNEEREQASIRFLKYIMSEPVQTRILEETEQIPANPRISFQDYAEKKPRLSQAAALVLDAEKKIDVPDNLWNAEQKDGFTEHILDVMSGKMSVEEFEKELE